MRVLETVGFVALLLVLILVAFFARRRLIARNGGTIDLSVRLHTFVDGRGWAIGRGRFVGDELRWYRMFSLSWKPGRVLSRRDLAIALRRVPDERERMVLPANWTILRCANRKGTVEIAMALSTMAGFLSWVEASPGTVPDVR
ncbi:MAG: DUF2550 domain-containing protein [Micromonosporaceae bacterium]|nr:DUF2550 domain-containing protein [Micromonosporaceae bacterium]